MSRQTILVSANINPRVIEGLGPHFDLVFLQGNDVFALSEAERNRITGFAVLGSAQPAVMDALPNLEIIANFGVGYDGVDVGHAANKTIMVTNTPDVLNAEVADTTIGLLLNTVRQLNAAENWLRAGRWAKDGNFPLTPLSLRERTVGLYGLGRIGLEIAHRAEAFGLKISYHTRSPRKDVDYPYYDSLSELAEAVDTLICIVPKTPETHKTIDGSLLQKLGRNGVLINVGRGWTVDEEALAEALVSGTIAAAGLDVFQDEPNVPAALMGLSNVCLLPHVASASIPTRNAMADLVVSNLVSWFAEGKAVTPVPETLFTREKS
jgi:lactate dehydrogenase-like 2-hydroxyacid dehydrogenase